MGRSMIVDLNAPANNNIRQVDHRTIQSIVLRNVKYSLGRKAPGTEEIPVKTDYDAPKWEASNLKKGNWFSQITYYKVKEIDDENVIVRTMKDSQTLTLSKDILNTEMNSGHAYDSEDKVTRTQLIEILQNARESCMTIKFHKKIDDKYIKEVMSENFKAAKDLKNAKLLAQVSKELTQGAATTMTCCLTNSETNKLGRSNILDLNVPHGMNFR